MKQLLFVLVIIVLSQGCKGPLSVPKASDTKSEIHKVVVNEVLQAGTYTYLNVTEKNKKIWLAVPSMQAVNGDTYYYTGGLEMTNFQSKELNRTFNSVLFLEGVSRLPVSAKNPDMNTPATPGKVKTEKLDISVAPGEGCISIGKLIAEKTSYSGKTVKVRGKITKFNPQIMGKNWIHIQDGTEFKGVYDLTITTDSQPATDEIVTFEGNIVLNKDFGYGYFYEVLMEDGKIIK